MGKKLQVPNIHGDIVDVWTIDFETYFDTKDKYSLGNKKSTTVQYIRDPRFRAHGCAVVEPDGNKYWVTHDDLYAFFNDIKWNDVAICGFNNAFDGLIAQEHYGVQANYYIDPLSMARGLWGPGVRNGLHYVSKRLGRKGKIEGVLETTDGIRELSSTQEAMLIPYAIQDVEECRGVFENMYFDLGYPELEMHIIDITLKAFILPKLQIDAALCRTEIAEEEIRMERLLSSDLIKDAKLSEICRNKLANEGIEGLMRSRPCFAELLLSRGVVPPMKQRIRKGEVVEGEMTYAFAKNDIELINLMDDERVSDLVAAWTGSKSTLRKTRAQRLLDVTEEGTKPLPIPLNYCGGRTHRWSGGGGDEGTYNPYNPQNLSSGRDGRGSRLREAIIAPKGYRVLVCDSAQVECRFIAWLGGEQELLDDFAHDRDPYSKLASEIFGVHVAKNNEYSHLRHVGKEGELSLGFGVGWKKFFNTIQTKYGLDASQFSEEDAQKTVTYYRSKRKGIVQLWKDVDNHLVHMAAKTCGAGRRYKNLVFKNDRIIMPNELPIQYMNFHWRYDPEQQKGNYVYQFKDDWVKIYAAKCVENIVQSIARTAVAQQAINIAKELPIVLLVHDEVVALAPEKEADDAIKFMIEEMSKPLSWCSDIPLAAEGKHSKCYIK